MEIPQGDWPHPEKTLREVKENLQGQVNLMKGTLSHRKNFSDTNLVRCASGGLPLQGMYKNSHQRGLIEKREEQGTLMETKQSTSSQAESMFTQTVEEGLNVTTSVKNGGWRFNLEIGRDHRKHSESKAHSIMSWMFQSESEQEHISISQFSELIKILRENENDLMKVKAKSASAEIVEKVQRKTTYDVSLSLGPFWQYFQETKKPDTQLLLCFIAAGAGYHVVSSTFQYLLGCDELNFLLNEMQSAQDKYQELKIICPYRTQAFLVLTGLIATVGVTAISPEEKTE
ncbi:interferon-induced very large GTPase 1-like [Phyllostomus discolor]|uniref:Interferon-induced very large GTPase 1-like n=1 Tax=Phyllostomus discolor TaxID=89673 RepID=A0A7E6E519_9CHIR|nr:interferon-induced very large GTPase 1-like [Phyllostomus discolor]